jgi:hypothetical protein
MGGVGPKAFMQTHRPPGDLKGGLHVSVYNQTFAHFIRDCNDIVPTRDECAIAVELVQAMSMHYRLEKKRQETAVPILEDYFDCVFTIPPGIESDEAILHKVGKLRFMLMNVEFKSEFGKGGSDAAMQNAGSFAKYWAKRHVESSRYRIASFLVSIVGPSLTVYGAVHNGDAAGIYIDPLTSCMLLLMTPDDRKAMTRLACTLAALKRGLSSMAADYSSQVDHPSAVDQREFPYLCKAETFSFTYVSKLSRRVFLAVVSDHDGQNNDVPAAGARVVVKFSPVGYCHGAYQVPAKHGYSPRVWAEFPLLPWWHVTITEYVENSLPYISTPGRDSKLRHAAKVLKDSGFVHGDLREPNVLVVPGSDQISVIDFDFAGRLEANATYPSFLNHTNISWPAGVADNCPLEYSHDEEWVKRLTTEAPPKQKRKRP